MKNKLTTLSIVTSAFLALTTTSVFAGENLIKNGSFEDYSIERNHGVWKEVTFTDWTGKGEAWNGGIGKSATQNRA